VIVRWNGKAWKRVPSPSPGLYDQLFGVTATSASNAWAVGLTQNTAGIHTLILHWNGKAWSQVPSPSPSPDDQLHAVTAISASNAWAVGTTGTLSAGPGLILHWNGKAWTRVPSPNPGKSDQLAGVAAISASNVWTVGTEYVSQGIGLPMAPKTLILHWNGKAWTRVPSPNPFCTTCDSLYGVAAASAHSVWAVGTVNLGAEVMILHWNGTHWANFNSANLLNYP
jgi:hypothetical protein